jgi:hypothetical protein
MSASSMLRKQSKYSILYENQLFRQIREDELTRKGRRIKTFIVGELREHLREQ